MRKFKKSSHEDKEGKFLTSKAIQDRLQHADQHSENPKNWKQTEVKFASRYDKEEYADLVKVRQDRNSK